MVRRFYRGLRVSAKIVVGSMQITLRGLERIDGFINVRTSRRQWNRQGYNSGGRDGC
jgi:hypothetical protein